MCLRELRIFFQFLNEPVIGPRLLDSEPRKEGRKKKHGYNRNVVRSRSNRPKLVPVHKILDFRF